ncbi:MAG: SGNH/GDSL hydrolase family protein, partial [Candidatus Tantalella remota]|nr:SGNH/GDSL hydrolase family protein [Candidatus Tantalella remota]
MKKVIINLFLCFFVMFIMVVVLEIVINTYLFNFASDEVFQQYASLEQMKKRVHFHHIAHRYLGHQPTPNYSKGQTHHNSFGFRADEIKFTKPENEFRIVCLGGSTTYTGSVKDNDKTYPSLLQKDLEERGYGNVNVINAGVNSYSSWETFINFVFKVLDYNPDMIIVYHGANDFTSRFVYPP